MNQLSPIEAHKFLGNHPEAVFIDVRSDIEYLLIGHPQGAISIPWQNDPDWQINPAFLGEVQKLASTNCPVVFICRSGRRSAEACRFLEEHGFRSVYFVSHGFEGDLDDNYHRSSVNGWRHDGLPWQQF